MAIKKLFRAEYIMKFIFATFIISIIYSIVRITSAPTIAPVSDVAIRVKSDYVLMLLQCILGAVAMLFPGVLSHKAKLNIPSVMIIMYAVFLYCAIFLGEVRNFYFLVPHWDTILHAFSGAALGALGFSIVSLLNKSESIQFSLSPIFVALFAFCFALTLGVIWELYEFAMDSLFQTNMLKHTLESGEPLVGLAAVTDTMKDFMVDALGAFVMSLIGYVSLKYNKGWLERIQIKQTN